MITVAIPLYKADKIAWLAMEGLCRQETTHPWELLVYEEDLEGACGEAYFDQYIDRLKKAGCVNFKYITDTTKKYLSQKWMRLGREADKNSKMFCICGGDDYHQKYMVQDAMHAYNQGYDWVTTRVGYFFNFLSGVLAEYNITNNPKAKTGLQKAVATELIRHLPNVERGRIIDNWLYRQCKPQRPKTLIEHVNSLGTDGYNTITMHRRGMVDSFKPPFYRTDKKLEDVVPTDVAQIIKKQWREWVVL